MEIVAFAFELILTIIMMLIADAMVLVLAVITGASIGMIGDLIVPHGSVVVTWVIWACYIINIAQFNYSVLAQTFRKVK